MRTLILAALSIEAMLALTQTRPAWSQEIAAQSASSGPCQRSTSRLTVGGLDLDVARCQVSLMANQLGAMQADLAGTRASLALSQDDLKAAQTVQDSANGKIAWWKKCVAEPVCVTWVNSKAAK